MHQHVKYAADLSSLNPDTSLPIVFKYSWATHELPFAPRNDRHESYSTYETERTSILALRSHSKVNDKRNLFREDSVNTQFSSYTMGPLALLQSFKQCRQRDEIDVLEENVTLLSNDDPEEKTDKRRINSLRFWTITNLFILALSIFTTSFRLLLGCSSNRSTAVQETSFYCKPWLPLSTVSHRAYSWQLPFSKTWMSNSRTSSSTVLFGLPKTHPGCAKSPAQN